MRIAYLILTHKDPKHLQNLIESLYIKGITSFFIHVDAKERIDSFKKQLTGFDDVDFIQNRLKVYWGGYNLCLAEKKLLETALKSIHNYDRLILLSGQDYPLWSNDKMLKQYEAYPQKIYMKCYNLSMVNYPPKIPQRIERYHFRDLPITNKTMRHFIIGGLMYLMNKLPIKKSRYILVGNTKWPVWGGSQWFNISRECAEYVLKEMQINKVVCNYFKMSFAPDEMMIQTIIFNSPFRKFADSFSEDGIYPGLEETSMTHYIEYHNGQKTFKIGDFDNLISSNKMFGRKFDSFESHELISRLIKFRNNNGN